MARELGARLLAAGLVSREALAEAISLAQSADRPLPEALCAGAITDDALAAHFLSRGFGPLVSPAAMRHAPAALVGRLPPEMAHTLLAFPVRSSPAGVVMAMADPGDGHAVRELMHAIGQPILPSVARVRDLRGVLDARVERPARESGDPEPVPLRPSLPQGHGDALPLTRLAEGDEPSNERVSVPDAAVRGASPIPLVARAEDRHSSNDRGRDGVESPRNEASAAEYDEAAPVPLVRSSGPAEAPIPLVRQSRPGAPPPDEAAGGAPRPAVRTAEDETPAAPVPNDAPARAGSVDARRPSEVATNVAAQRPSNAAPSDAVVDENSRRGVFAKPAAIQPTKRASGPPPVEGSWLDLGPARNDVSAETPPTRSRAFADEGKRRALRDRSWGKPQPPGDVGPTLAGMRGAASRDEAVDLACQGALSVSKNVVFLGRRRGVLVGLHGAGPGATLASVRNILIPESSPSTFSRVATQGDSHDGAHGTEAADQLFRAALGSRSGRIVVLPVDIAGRIVGVVAADDVRFGEAGRERLSAIAHGLGRALERIVLSKKR